jgi:hypothetical protein
VGCLAHRSRKVDTVADGSLTLLSAFCPRRVGYCGR